MGTPCHFKIPGHSGTDVKHRRAFAQRKEYLKKGIFYKNKKRSFTSINKKLIPKKADFEKYKLTKKIAFILAIFFLLSIGGIIYTLGNLYKKPFYEFMNANPKYETIENKNIAAYNFLVKSGNRLLESDYFDSAQREFMLALKIDEYGKAARIGLTKVLIEKCKTSFELCEEMEENIAFLIQSKYVSLEEVEKWKSKNK